MKKRILATIVATALCFCSTTNAFAGWYQQDGRWRYEENGRDCKHATRVINGAQYLFDKDGYMITGWYQHASGSYWYYYDVNTGAKLQNQWVDNTYYVGYDGRMLFDQYTGDGYYVGADGKYVPGRTQTPKGLGPDNVPVHPATDLVGSPVDGSIASYTSEERPRIDTPQEENNANITADLSAWNEDFPLYMAMSDRLRAEATDLGCIAINRGDSDMVIYSAMARTTNDILGKAATRYMYLTYSNDGATWHKALSVRIKPQEQIYLNFVIVGDPIVSGISTSLNYVVEYHGVAYIVSKEPEQEKTWSVPLQNIYPNGEFTLANFQNNTWPQEIKAIFGIN